MRGHHEGTIYRRKDRGTWRVVVSMPDGNRQYRTAPTRAEATALLRKMLREVDSGRRATRSPTVADFLREWLDEGVHVRPSTERRYRTIVERHLVPGLGAVRLRDLDALVVQRFLNRVGGSPRTVGHYRAVLRTALAWGQRLHLVTSNAAADSHGPRIPDAEPATLTVSQAHHLIEGTRGEWLGPLWALAVTTGMREAELLGLAWDDVADGRITIRQTLVRHNGAWAFDEPKTARSRRVVPLTATAAEALTEHRRRMVATRTPDWPYFGLVFTTPAGMPFYGWYILQELYVAEERLGLPRVSVHGLRHSAASIMLASGFGLEDVKNILGHTSIRITSDTYAHPNIDHLATLTGGLDEAISKAL